MLLPQLRGLPVPFMAALSFQYLLVPLMSVGTLTSIPSSLWARMNATLMSITMMARLESAARLHMPTQNA